jgi:hypothetical protein
MLKLRMRSIVVVNVASFVSDVVDFREVPPRASRAFTCPPPAQVPSDSGKSLLNAQGLSGAT